MNITTVFIASAILFLLLVILVVTFVLFYQKKMLQQQFNVQQLTHNREMDLMQATIDAQEQEQNRIGKDLHDDLGALLTASRIQIQQVERYLDKDSKLNSFVELSSEMLNQSIERLSSIAKSLAPPTLEHFGIKDALEEYAKQFSHSGEIRIHTSIVDKRYPPLIELALFRMTQELVNNTVKYANASEILISITTDASWIWLNYSDNGIGVDPKTVKKGLGLRNLEGRSTHLGGSFNIELKKNPGFYANIQLPLKKQNHEK
ncbi:MAG: sensor histidine kinase [Flavobacteriales bacterium]|nr:sensor histidine kinase [Flavobacteriales bacterium]